MPSYQLAILRRAQKELGALPKQSYTRIRDTIFTLAEEPRPAGCKKLKGRDGWRVRVGRCRVIYEVDDAERTVTVLHIGHRRDVYDK